MQAFAVRVEHRERFDPDDGDRARCGLLKAFLCGRRADGLKDAHEPHPELEACGGQEHCDLHLVALSDALEAVEQRGAERGVAGDEGVASSRRRSSFRATASSPSTGSGARACPGFVGSMRCTRCGRGDDCKNVAKSVKGVNVAADEPDDLAELVELQARSSPSMRTRLDICARRRRSGGCATASSPWLVAKPSGSTFQNRPMWAAPSAETAWLVGHLEPAEAAQLEERLPSLVGARHDRSWMQSATSTATSMRSRARAGRGSTRGHAGREARERARRGVAAGVAAVSPDARRRWPQGRDGRLHLVGAQEA